MMLDAVEIADNSHRHCQFLSCGICDTTAWSSVVKNPSIRVSIFPFLQIRLDGGFVVVAVVTLAVVV
jgi:hypothetical protein